MDDQLKNRIIAMAWADRVSFELIKKKTGLSESEVIKLMRQELKPSGFRRWRRRVNGRSTKHRKLFKSQRKGPGLSDEWPK